MPDPKDIHAKFARHTLELDEATRRKACDNFFAVVVEHDRVEFPTWGDREQAKAHWDLMWAAGVCAYLYMSSGDMGPEPPPSADVV